MRTRGRRSAAEDGVVVVGGFAKRPDPPRSLTYRQEQIWREVVASEPVEFFNTGALRLLLKDYCCHCEAAENITSVLNTITPACLTTPSESYRYDDLLKMRERETRAAGNIATRLRLTNQSRIQPRTAGTMVEQTARTAKPWQA